MILTNQTRKTTLTSNLKEAKSISDKFLGLLNPENPRSLLFETRFGIHTLFLKHSVDVLILDSQNQVVASKTLKPNRMFIYNPMHSIVIELPAGTIKKSKTKIGDKLNFNKAPLH